METNEETWDTGEVRRQCANHIHLYKYVQSWGDELTPPALRNLWGQESPNDSVDTAKVDWVGLAAELVVEARENEESDDLADVFDGVEADTYVEAEAEVLNALVDDLAVALDLIGSTSAFDPERGDAEQVQASLARLAFIVDQRIDRSSSASRQHWIDTGRYLRVGEVSTDA